MEKKDFYLVDIMNKLPVEDEFFEMNNETLVMTLTERLKNLDHDLKEYDCPSCGACAPWKEDTRTNECSCRDCGLLMDVAMDVWENILQKG